LLIELKIKSQEIIDLIAQKKVSGAEAKLSEVTEQVNDLIDFSTANEALQELSRYQILLRHLQLKITVLKTSLN
jgi:predicted translin family RNA/ssDNA-binding protein